MLGVQKKDYYQHMLKKEQVFKIEHHFLCHECFFPELIMSQWSMEPSHPKA